MVTICCLFGTFLRLTSIRFCFSVVDFYLDMEILSECSQRNCLCHFTGPSKCVLKIPGEIWKKCGFKNIYVKRTAKKAGSEDDSSRSDRENINVHDFCIDAKVSGMSELGCCPLSSLYPEAVFIKVHFEQQIGLSNLIAEFLKNGLEIEIGRSRKHFELFGYSASQLRDRTCVLYDSGLGSWRDVVMKFGQFEVIKSVSKFSARVGLLLSPAIDFKDRKILLTENQISRIEDIERNGFTFTDGCGQVASEIAYQLAEVLQSLGLLNKWLYEKQMFPYPSVFQIRMIGCKGVIALNPLVKNNVLIRPSMEKFKWKLSPPYNLGVVSNGFSRPYEFGNLNKQYIMVLSALGIKNCVFLDLQMKYFEELENLESDPMLALQYLCLEDDKWHLVERLFRTKTIDEDTKKVLKKIRMWVRSKPDTKGGNKLLKEKCELARALKIPIWKSRNIFGVCDETAKLEQGEVFLQVTIDGEPQVIEDGTRVIVTRCPCHSPGDIRILKCRFLPELRHLNDCVVFPTKGKRPHADEMSGGDLDGDKFFVCWDERLIPADEAEPMNFQSSGKAREEETVQQLHLIEEFARYDSSLLGRVTNLFNRWADASSDGVKSPHCQVLRMKCSRAVDAAKTGQVVKTDRSFRSVPPANSENVWIKMAEIADLYLGNELEFASPSDFKAIDFEEIEQILDERLLTLTEYQLFRMVLKWSSAFGDNHGDQLRQLCRKIDFSRFTANEQKEVLSSGFESELLTEMMCSSYRSEIVTSDEVSGILPIDIRSPWLLYYAENSSSVNWNVLEGILSAEFPKMIIFRPDNEAFNVVIGITFGYAPINGLRLECKECKVFLLDRSFSGANHVVDVDGKTHFVDFDVEDRRLQIYQGQIGNTFVFLKETKPGCTVLSVALNRFRGVDGNLLGRLNKQCLTRIEVYSKHNAALILHRPAMQANSGDSSQPAEAVGLVQSFVHSAEDFPEFDGNKIRTVEPDRREKSPLQTLLGLLRKPTNEDTPGHVLELYRLMAEGGEASNGIARQLVFFLHNHNCTLETTDQYLTLTLSILSSMDTYADTRSAHYFVDKLDKEGLFFRSEIERIGESMQRAGLFFSAQEFCTLLRHLAISPPRQRNAIDALTQLLLLAKEGKLFPISAGRGPNSLAYFLHWSCLLTIQEFHENVEEYGKCANKGTFQTALILKTNDTEYAEASSICKLSVIPSSSLFDSIKAGKALALSPILSDNLAPFAVTAQVEIVQADLSDGLLTGRIISGKISFSKTYRVDCVPNVTPLDRQLKALRLICFPDLEFECSPVAMSLVNSFFNQANTLVLRNDETERTNLEEKMNPSQLKAIRSAVTNPLTLVHGPPGTGKTRVAASIVKNWISAGYFPVLCVAETNFAINNLAEKVLQDGAISREELLRIGSEGQTSEFVDKITLETVYKESFGETKRNREHFLDSAKVEKLIRRSKVVFATCKGSGRAMLSLTDKNSDRSLFRAVLVDEAAQALEPTILVPLAQSYCERLCLVGDNCQLPPLVKVDCVREELSKSLFSRLKPKLSILLDVQYRMHPQIARFSNKYFYGGKLKNGDGLADRPLPLGFSWPKNSPVCFVDVDNEVPEKCQSGSRMNETEANAIVETIEKLLSANDVPPSGIGIITPYSAQERCLKKLLAEKKLKIDVRTVDGFQGQERDLILVSLVRNQRSIGFLTDDCRMNVLLTRAKRGLIVFGCEKTLSADRNTTWAKWIGEMQFSGLVIYKRTSDASVAVTVPSNNKSRGYHGQRGRRF